MGTQSHFQTASLCPRNKLQTNKPHESRLSATLYNLRGVSIRQIEIIFTKMEMLRNSSKTGFMS